MNHPGATTSSARQGRRLAEAATDEDRDWANAPMAELADHIENEHHAFLRRELPLLSTMIDKLVEAHGRRHAELAGCREVFRLLRSELEPHMAKEENVLFPMIRALEGSATRPDFHCGRLLNPIRVMEGEHDAAGHALSQLKELTRGYSPPDDACTTYRAVFAGLAALDADLRRHIHEESDILFPRALAEEASRPPA